MISQNAQSEFNNVSFFINIYNIGVVNRAWVSVVFSNTELTYYHFITIIYFAIDL